MLIIYKHGGKGYLHSKQTNWSHYQKMHQLHRRDLLKPPNIEKNWANEHKSSKNNACFPEVGVTTPFSP